MCLRWRGRRKGWSSITGTSIHSAKSDALLSFVRLGALCGARCVRDVRFGEWEPQRVGWLVVYGWHGLRVVNLS